MGIGFEILRQEDAEKAVQAERARRAAHRTLEQGRVRTQLAEVERQIAQIKAQLDQYPDDPPEIWPLRKKLASLYRERQELIAQ